MIHAQLFQRPFNNSKSISCRWYCQCSLEYFHSYKTHLRLGWLLYGVSRKNVAEMYALLVPSRICQTYAWKAHETKVILSKGGKGKVFNLTLMNKLMRIDWASEWVSEWVIECHSSTTKSPWHDYVIHELKSRTDTWRGSSKGRSLILKKTKYPKLPCIFHYYSWLPITRTLANSNQSRFDLHIYCNFTLGNSILANSNLPLTRGNFSFF